MSGREATYSGCKFWRSYKKLDFDVKYSTVKEYERGMKMGLGDKATVWFETMLEK